MAQVLLQEKRHLSREKDELGRFALHYAAFLGYDEIVEELVNEYRSAAYQADNDGKTALHLAAGNGKAKAVKKLVDMCPNCSELVDNRGRNALHLALTSADESTIQFFLKEPALGNLINQKDKEGDTPLLQLANSVPDKGTFIDHHKVDKLVFNKENKNAADIILAKDSSMVDQERLLSKLKMIKEKRCRRVVVPSQEVIEGVNRPPTISIRKAKDKQSEDIKKPNEERSEDIMKRKVEEKNDDGSEKIKEIMKDAGETHTVAATLIATVTFAAAFTLPGGYIGEGNPNEGTALLTRNESFQGFVIFDTVAFLLSCSAVLIHLTNALQKDKTRRFEQFQIQLLMTYYAMVAMLFAFVAGLYAVLYPNRSLAIPACVLGCLLTLQCLYEINEAIQPIVKLAVTLRLKKKARNVAFYEDRSPWVMFKRDVLAVFTIE